MERTRQIKKPDLILTSDWHLREDTPVCWTGDFQEEQWNSVGFISGLQIKYRCPVIHTGDLFHHWKPSPWLLTKASSLLPQNFISIYGQHDLPQHNMGLSEKCGLFNLYINGKVTIPRGCHFGQEPNIEMMIPIKGKKILLWHHLTYLTPPFPGATGGQANYILKKYPQFDLIVTGDNHQSFVTCFGKRLLVNPGSLTRQKADQIDFEPKVFLWYTDTNTVNSIKIPIQKDVISREHIDVKQERDARIDAFISKLDTDYKAEMSFEDNLELFFKKNQVRDSVKQIIYKALET